MQNASDILPFDCKSFIDFNENFESSPKNFINKRVIQRLEFPSENKDTKSFTFLILPSKKTPTNNEESLFRIVLLEDELPEFLKKKKPLKTKKFIIQNFNSIIVNNIPESIDSSFIHTSESIKTPEENNNNIEQQETPKKHNSKEQSACNCKKSRCLKLYCECFLTQRFCGPNCSCFDCLNQEKFAEKRQKFIDQVKEKNPLAFTPKIDKNNESSSKNNQLLIKHNKGCNCRKSNCLKKYCECFQAGVKCTDLCKCEDCRNSDFINKSLLFFRKPKDDFKEDQWETQKKNEMLNFYEENQDKNSFTNGFKNFTTKKHQLNSFNSFHSVMRDV